MRLRLTSGILAFGVLSAGASAASAQEYASKPIRIVTGSAGGGRTSRRASWRRRCQPRWDSR